jgi:DNA replication licensing factor MCM7
VANRESKVILIDLDDLKEHFSAARDTGLVERVLHNTARYIDLFSQVIDQNMPKPSLNFRE